MHPKTSKILIIATIFMVFAIILFLSGCQKQSVGNNESADNNQTKQECGLENCHGLELSCGSNAPEVCAENYELGDFCRQYASCQIIDGRCQLSKSQEFDLCKLCVEDCEKEKDNQKVFECENGCRTIKID